MLESVYITIFYIILFYFIVICITISKYGGVENPGPKKGEEKGGEREGIHTINILNYIKAQRGLDMFFLGAWGWPILLAYSFMEPPIFMAI